MPKNAEKYNCDICDFKCSKKSNFNTHVLTDKHLLRAQGYKKDMICSKKMPDMLENYMCQCGKHYKYYSGLWKHKKKCDFDSDDKNMIDLLINENKDFKNIILELMKNNSDLQKQMMDVCKTGNNTIISNNSHNKTFNLQVFLNEQCKDAMNIMDFVNSMTLEFADLEEVGKLGYVEGISNIIIKKLNEMDVYKRPIHCSDGKREIIYVKDDNVWGKENSTYDKLRKAIKYVTKKNGDMMIPWSQKYPMCMNTSHPQNDIYIQIMNQAMGGKESFVESENKIMKKIAKAVLIDKM
jgi:hypothetical protein